MNNVKPTDAIHYVHLNMDTRQLTTQVELDEYVRKHGSGLWRAIPHWSSGTCLIAYGTKEFGEGEAVFAYHEARK